MELGGLEIDLLSQSMHKVATRKKFSSEMAARILPKIEELMGRYAVESCPEIK